MTWGARCHYQARKKGALSLTIIWPKLCGGTVDAFGDQALPCPRTGLLARRAKVVEHAWVRVAWAAVGPEGQVVPQQWLAHTTAPGVQPQDRRRLDLVVYGATTRGGALCCDVTLVSLPTRTGHPQPCAIQVDGRPAGCRASQAGSLPLSSRAEARKHCWCWGPRSAFDGSVTSSEDFSRTSHASGFFFFFSRISGRGLSPVKFGQSLRAKIASVRSLMKGEISAGPSRLPLR